MPSSKRRPPRAGKARPGVAKAIPAAISLPESLPIAAVADDIARALARHQVLVVAGDTGSGKTTQLPKICLRAGFGRRGLIGHTQPRRLAAITVANRIAEELGCQPGNGVGYQIRFEKQAQGELFLKLMTDGILLAELQGDPQLRAYEALIIDEAHERSLNIDFLLGIIKQLLPKRPDLRVIITSATIDEEQFARHFDNAPIIRVAGRSYPVTTHYRPLAEGRESASGEAQLNGIGEAVAWCLGEGGDRGDILVFLASEREIRETAAWLRKRRHVLGSRGDVEILPLYSRLRQAEQRKVFAPHRRRRVVLATNVAETSLTVPGIHYVIDSGRARIGRYNARHKVQRLPIEPVSQASAEQRKGRCGRIAPGICLRLYDEGDFAARPAFTEPEIKRTSLAAVILRMLSLRLGEINEFPFIDPPEKAAVREGQALLRELEAIDPQGRLTARGRLMARLAVDPTHAAMVVSAAGCGALREILIIVSALAAGDPRQVNLAQGKEALAALAESWHGESDFLGFVTLWQRFEHERQARSGSELRAWCEGSHLNYARMREWRELHTQLLMAARRLGLRLNDGAASYETVHGALIGASLGLIARAAGRGLFEGVHGRQFKLFPTSTLHGSAAKWVVTGPLLDTGQTYALLAARIKPEWVMGVARHMLKVDYFDAHWSGRRQEVMVYERSRLHSLTLVERNVVRYREVDAPAAREIFIREALAADNIRTELEFVSRNRAYLKQLRRQEEKLRKPEAILSDFAIFHFYAERLPEDISSTRALEDWHAGLSPERRAALLMADATLGIREPPAALASFPDHAVVARNRLAIDYVFDPASARDGATVTLPLALLGQVSQGDVDWTVPGLLRERCVMLLKSLPKGLRKRFVPVGDFVDRLLPCLDAADGSLVDSLRRALAREHGLRLSAGDFAAMDLPRHLRIGVAVVDEAGKVVAEGEGVEELQSRLGRPPEPAQPVPRHPIEQRQLVDWTFGELPGKVTLEGHLTLIRYPALVDRKTHVDIELLPAAAEARRASAAGFLRLCALRNATRVTRLRRRFQALVNDQALLLARLGDLSEDAVLLCLREAFLAAPELLPRNREQFEARLTGGGKALGTVAERLEGLLPTLLRDHHALRRRSGELPASLAYLREDVDSQLERLFAGGFLGHGLARLQEYPRYLEALAARLEKAPHMGARDRDGTETLQAYWRRLDECLGGAAEAPDTLSREREEAGDELRWLLEEYRVSLFAQRLGTKVKVSPTRIERLFAILSPGAG